MSGRHTFKQLVPRWGQPGSILVPQLLLTNVRYRTLPKSLRTINRSKGSDLSDYWSNCDRPLSSGQKSDLVRFLRLDQLPAELLLFRNKSEIENILDFADIGTRTRSVLGRIFSNSDEPEFCLLIGEFLWQPSAGHMTLLEVLSALEGLVDHRGPSISSKLQDESELINASKADFYSPTTSYLSQEFVSLLEESISALSIMDNSDSIVNINLSSLASRMSEVICQEPSKFNDSIFEIDGNPLIAKIEANVVGFLTSLSDVEVDILNRRILPQSRLTLDSLAQLHKLSRERIRQLQNRLIDRAHERFGGTLDVIIAVAIDRLPPIFEQEEWESIIDNPISQIVYEINTPSVVDAQEFIHWLFLSKLEKYAINGKYVTSLAQSFLEYLVSLCPDDDGIVIENILNIQHYGLDLREYGGQLAELCGLKVIWTSIAVNDTPRSRIKAYLLACRESVTTHVISRSVDVPLTEVGRLLMSMTSVEQVGPGEWSLRGEMHCLESDKELSGTQWTEIDTHRAEQVDPNIGAKPACLTNVTHTGIDGLANQSQSPRERGEANVDSLRTVASGYTQEGIPFWEFDFNHRYLEGVSLREVPLPVLLKYSKSPDRVVTVPVEIPQGCMGVSVSWSVTSSDACTIGHLSQVLTKLKCREGDRVRMILNDRQSMHFEKVDQRSDLEESPLKPILEADQLQREGQLLKPSERVSHDALERLKSRRRF